MVESGDTVDSNSASREDLKARAATTAVRTLEQRAHIEYAGLLAKDGIFGRRFHIFIWQAQILYGDRRAQVARILCKWLAREVDTCEHRTRVVQAERSRHQRLAKV